MELPITMPPGGMKYWGCHQGFMPRIKAVTVKETISP